MASVVQKMENTLTCAICTEVFRQPVTLPCQHSYCRECLQAFSKTSGKKNGTPTGTEDTSSNADDSPSQSEFTLTMSNDTPTNEDCYISSSEIQKKMSVVICCPVCRKPSDLGSRGVADLSTNFILAEMVETLQAESRTEETVPLCGMCEEEKRLAVKACSICRVLYCHDCLLSLHPNRGSLREHVVIPVKEYLSQQTETNQEKTEAASQGTDPSATCGKHNETLSIYCVTCQELICIGCLKQHDDHNVSSIETACHKQKVQILENVKVCEEDKDKLATCLQKIQALIGDIKSQEMCHMSEIQRAFDEALKALERWRKNAMEAVEQRHKTWLGHWNSVLKDLQIQSEEMETLVITTKEVTSG